MRYPLSLVIFIVPPRELIRSYILTVPIPAVTAEEEKAVPLSCMIIL